MLTSKLFSVRADPLPIERIYDITYLLVEVMENFVTLVPHKFKVKKESLENQDDDTAEAPPPTPTPLPTKANIVLYLEIET